MLEVPQYVGFFTSTSLFPIVQDLNMYGPVPIGCCVPNVPVGWNTPSGVTVPASALYFTSAVGLAMPKTDRPSAPRKPPDLRVSMITA